MVAGCCRKKEDLCSVPKHHLALNRAQYVAVLPFSNNRCVSQNRRANIEKLLAELLAVYSHFSQTQASKHARDIGN